MHDAAAVLEQLAQPRPSALVVGDVTVRVTNLDKVLWPASGDQRAYTKRDLLAYYACLSEYLLAHLRDRPLTLTRYPNGISGKHFYQKHIEAAQTSFVAHEPLFAEQDHSEDARRRVLATRTVGAPVSMPLRWDELSQVYPPDFSIETAPARMAGVGDLWREILAAKVDLSAALDTPRGTSPRAA